MPSLHHFEVPGIPSDLYPAHRWKLHFNSPTRINGVTDTADMLLQNSGNMLLQNSGNMLLQDNS